MKTAPIRSRISLFFYGRAMRHAWGKRRRRAWAVPAIVFDVDFPLWRRKAAALCFSKQPREGE